MKPFTQVLLVAAMATTLAACGQKAAEPVADAEPAAPAMTTKGEAMAGMDMAGARMAKGSGTVTAIDKAAGAITIDHGPIAEIEWPAMSMEFKANPAGLPDTVKVGDKVSFDLKMTDGVGEVTAVRPQ